MAAQSTFGVLPAARGAHLASVRAVKMARSSHAYVRGSTVQFYEWLEGASSNLPQGPVVWICGDCHAGNLGPTSDGKGRVAVQIRDLDQTVLGNPAHDIVRLGLSLASAARGSDLSGLTTVRIVEQLVKGYRSALSGDFELERDRSNRARVIQSVLTQATKRNWKSLARERLRDTRPQFPMGKRFWSVLPDEHEALEELVSSETVRRLLTSIASRDDDASVALVDMAYWMKGCSSLGRLRFAALVKVGTGAGSAMAVLDVKEATPAAAPRANNVQMPADNADRVVAGARALSPALGNRMLPAALLGRSVVLRELMPQDLKLEIGRLDDNEAGRLAAYLGKVVGRAHGRQMDSETRRDWIAELNAHHARSLDAPSWLWTSIVELIGHHEAAYLEHCRIHVQTSKQIPQYV